jgi:hypothetical protein
MNSKHPYDSPRLFPKIVWLLFWVFSFINSPAQDTDSLSAVLDSAAVKEQEPDTDHPQYFDYYSAYLHQDDTLQLRTVPDSVVIKYKSDPAFCYADRSFNKKEEKQPEEDPSFLSRLFRKQWFKALTWFIIIGGFIAVLIWYLAVNDAGIFRSRPKSIDPESESGEMPENIFEINYEKEIDKAISNADYRLAVRLLFLRLLKNCADKNIIQYKQEKTNLDYLMQLYNTSYYSHFFRLTRDYEYTWYGQFELNREKFDLIKTDFEKFDQLIKYS